MRPINNNSDDYDKTYMEIKLNIGDDLPLKKILELHNIIIVVRSFFFYGVTKYYPQIFLDACLYKLT